MAFQSGISTVRGEPGWRLVLLLAALAFTGVPLPRLRANDEAREQGAPSGRQAEIDDLLTRGALGEDCRGFLQARVSLSSDAADLMARENAARASRYGQQAQEEGMTAEEVGRAAAARRAKACPPGTWIQQRNGEWKRK